MGHGSIPRSTSAPVNATAGPSLIPDLITRIPCEWLELQKWCGHGPASRGAGLSRETFQQPVPPGLGPRWILFIAILAAGVLVVSCLLCVICCCCYRHRRRKQPKDKEAVGLGSAHNSTTTHLVRSRNPSLPVSNPVLAHSREGDARFKPGSSRKPWQAFFSEEGDEQR